MLQSYTMSRFEKFPKCIHVTKAKFVLRIDIINIRAKWYAPDEKNNTLSVT